MVIPLIYSYKIQLFPIRSYIKLVKESSVESLLTSTKSPLNRQGRVEELMDTSGKKRGPEII